MGGSSSGRWGPSKSPQLGVPEQGADVPWWPVPPATKPLASPQLNSDPFREEPCPRPRPRRTPEARRGPPRRASAEGRMGGRARWPRTRRLSTPRLWSNLKIVPSRASRTQIWKRLNVSAAASACAGSACARAYRCTHTRLCLCPGIGAARGHSFQFCRSSRWIIAAPKCLICSPGHGQISEPTNLIELSIPAGKGYRVAAHTAHAE